MQFRQDNIIDFKGQFGCAIVVLETDATLKYADDDDDEDFYEDEEPEVKSKVEQKYEAFSRNEPKVSGWNNHRSFFFATTGTVQLDFKAENKYGIKSLVQGKVVDLNMQFQEAKVFAGDEEIFGEEEGLNDRLELLKMLIMRTGLKTFFGEMASVV